MPKAPRRDNRIVVSLKHVQYARFYYENQHGQKRVDCSYRDHFSVRNEWHTKKETVVNGKGQLLYEYARERGLLDVWTPTLYLQLTANHALIYTGPKAVSLWEAWRAMQFKKKHIER